MGQGIQEWTKSNFWNTTWVDHIISNFKGCFPQIALGPFLITLTHMF